MGWKLGSCAAAMVVCRGRDEEEDESRTRTRMRRDRIGMPARLASYLYLRGLRLGAVPSRGNRFRLIEMISIQSLDACLRNP